MFRGVIVTHIFEKLGTLCGVIGLICVCAAFLFLIPPLAQCGIGIALIGILTIIIERNIERKFKQTNNLFEVK